MILNHIISGSQTGAERAALDVAVRFGIPHGGWAAMNRPDKEDPAFERYRLKEMPSPNDSARFANNVLFSDGTLIVSHGFFSSGLELVIHLAGVYRRPCLHVDLHHASITQSAILLKSWIKMNAVRKLYVTGPTQTEDPRIYQDTVNLFQRVIQTSRGSAYPKGADRSRIDNHPKTDDLFDEIISELPFKERVAIANMEKTDIKEVQQVFDRYVRKNFDFSDMDDDHTDFIQKLWEKLRETYRLRVVK